MVLVVLFVQVDSGLKDDLVLGDPDAPRFVLWNGKLRPVPGKPTDLPFFDLMSIGGKIRAGFGALGIRPPPPVCFLLIPFFCLIFLLC
jgi:protoporphyrinogen/coproporphyrinogen III oxidase